MDKKKISKFSIVFLLLITVAITGCSNEGNNQDKSNEKYCYQVYEGDRSYMRTTRMSLTEAKEIASNSKCSDVGVLKGNYVCNETSGTWRIDLDIDVTGCKAWCFVDVETKKAEIAYKCQ